MLVEPQEQLQSEPLTEGEIREVLQQAPKSNTSQGLHALFAKAICPSAGSTRSTPALVCGKYYHLLHYIANKTGNNNFAYFDFIFESVLEARDSLDNPRSALDRAKSEAERLFSIYRIDVSDPLLPEIVASEEPISISGCDTVGFDAYVVNIPKPFVTSGYVLGGRPDRVEIRDGKLYGRDYKSLFAKNEGDKEAKLDTHVSGFNGMFLAWYQLIIGHQYGRTCHGMILDIAWKELRPKFTQSVLDFRDSVYFERLQTFFDTINFRFLTCPTMVNFGACQYLACTKCWE